MTMPPATDKSPWIFRTYAGHSTAEESNRLYRRNLGKGQTGLSVAFDLPTQMGYDSDHPLARDEVGRVGVAISHIGDMQELLAEIPLEEMNSSMTINATAAWLLALYVAVADERGIARPLLTGTTQNDIIKEYLSRGTHIFPPAQSLKLARDVIGFCAREMPKWNPINVCSYHLQEAGATPVQEIAYALATAVAVLDGVKQDAQIVPDKFPAIVGRISFFVNAGMKFITEICKLRAFGELWDEVCRERYGISEERFRRFRFGVQVNSLGLTEQQPENNVHRIMVELLAVVLSKNARARAVQLPAWNEAMGLPRPWDQQWSLRMQQVVAYETDLLDYGDIFDGSHEIAKQTQALVADARLELNRVLKMGGAAAAVDEGYMKRQLVAANSERLRAIENGEIILVGVNAFVESEASPLSGGAMVASIGDGVEYDQIARLKAWRAKRDNGIAKLALADLAQAAREGRNIMEASIACARAGVTTGEWGGTLREIFGEYRAPTGVVLLAAGERAADLVQLRRAVSDLGAKLGEPVRFMIAKPGLDGHSNGAEQIALRAAHCGIAVSYDGIRMTPEQIVAAAGDRKPHIVGLSVLSGSHVPLVREVMNRLRDAGLSGTPVVVGGIISAEDEHVLKQLGVRRVYTPKDFRLNQLIAEMIEIVDARLGEDAA
ncbi:MAG TPA: methylmalonyl-CoA mutase family protein [Aestuariivirgaceae bacterium]|nr:methylmalonyl-CoA mutase family protein [Aestuariivirgaceae bacterium]